MRRAGFVIAGLAALGSVAWFGVREPSTHVAGVDEAASQHRVLPEAASALSRFERDEVVSNSLRGHVVDPRGNQVDGAIVNAWIARDEAVDGCGPVHQPVSTRSDATGSFTVELTGNQLYCVQADHESWATNEPLLIAAVDASTSLARLVLSPTRQILGKVIGVSSDEIAGVSLWWRNTATGERRASNVDAQGHFQVSGLSPGSYDVKSGDARFVVEQPTEVVLGPEPISDLEVKLFAAAFVTGKVLGRTGAPLGGAEVQIYAPYAPDELLGNARTGADGSFRLMSKHESEKAQQIRRMFANAEGFEGVSASAPVMPQHLCLALSHPEFDARIVEIVPSGPSTDVGTVQLRESTTRVRGVVLNHRNEPTAARLTFRRVRLTNDALPSTCDGFSSMQLRTNAAGEFDGSLPAHRYEVEIHSKRYQPQIIELDLSSSPSEIQLKLK